jgi:hypothetical protein
MQPRFEQLEPRSLMTIIMVDCDTGALPVARMNGGDLAPYLAPGWNWETNTADTSDRQGPGGHGSLMAAQYASKMRDAGLPATVIPAVVCDSTGTNIDPYAVGRALQWAAAAQRAHPSDQLLVTLPIQGMGGWIPEQNGLFACARAGVPVSVAAGNYGLNLDAPFSYVAPAIYARYDANILVVAATAQDGSLRSYSDYGPRSVPVAAKSQYDDGYGHYGDLGTSGASATGAAALARFMAAHPFYGSVARSWYASWTVAATKASAQYVQADSGRIGYGVIG